MSRRGRPAQKRKPQHADGTVLLIDPESAPQLIRTSSRATRLVGWALLLAVLLLVAAVRIRLRDVPLERDEGEYAYAGQLILDGVPPYTLAYNMKFPGTYAAYAVLMAVLGQTPAGLHFGLALVTTLSALMLVCGARGFLDATAGIVASASFAVLAASPAMSGLAGHATHFCALFVIAGLCALWPPGETPSWRRAAGGGFLFGLAVLMKQHASFLWLWSAASLGINAMRQRDVRWSVRLRAPAAFGLGGLLPLALTGVILAWLGVLERFWFWTILYAREYASLASIKGDAPLAALAGATEKTTGLWLVAAAGAGLIWTDRRLQGMRGAILGFVVASFLTTCPGLLFRDHYFLLTLPAIALLAGCAVSAVQRSSVPFASYAGLAFAVLLGASILQNRDVWFDAAAADVSRITYAGNLFVEAEAVAEYIRGHSAGDARVAVLGSEPQIYFLSRRRSATGYIYMYPLMEPQPYADRMQREMTSEIESARPDYVVYVRSALSWLRTPSSQVNVFDWWMSYKREFALVMVALNDQRQGTRLLSGADLASLRELPDEGVFVYRRR